MNLDLTKIMRDDTAPEEQLQAAQEALSKALTEMAQYGVICQTSLYEWTRLTGEEAHPESVSDELKHSLAILSRAFYETRDKDSDFIGNQLDSSNFECALSDEAVADLRTLILNFHGNHVIATNETDREIAIRLATELIKSKATLPAIRSDHRLTDVSLKPYDSALTMTPNPYAFIAPLGTDIFAKYKIDPQTNQVMQLSNGEPLEDRNNALMMKNAAKDADHSEYDSTLVRSLLNYMNNNPHMIHGDNIDIAYHDVTKPLCIDATHMNALSKAIQALDPYYGIVFDDGIFQGIYAVMKFVKRDDVKKVLTLSSPYLIKVREVVEENSKRIKQNRKKQTLLGYNRLIHTEIHKEQNWTAIEIAERITNLLLQNPNKKRTKDHKLEPCVFTHTRFKTIGEATDLQNRIDNIKDNREKTKAIRAAFDKAFEFLKTYTDVFGYFSGLEIYTMDSNGVKNILDVDSLGKEKPKGSYTGISPTYAEYNADTVLYFKHYGVNKKWMHEASKSESKTVCGKR